MNKHAKKLSIILTLVMILTSFGFTGAFAVDEDGAEPAAVDQVEATEPAEEDAVVEEPAEEPAEVDAVVEEPAEDAAVEEAEEETEDVDGLDTVTPEAPAADDEDTFTITWKVGKASKKVKFKKDEIPQYEGTPVPEGYDETYTTDNYRFTGWTDGTKTYAVGAALPAVTANATYTAKFLSLNVAPGVPNYKKNKHNMAYSSYKSVWIEMNAAKDKNGYAYAEDVVKKVNYTVRPERASLATKTVKEKYHSEKILNPLLTYIFFVKTNVEFTDGNVKHSKELTIKGTPVRPMRYKLYIKEGGTLTCHYKVVNGTYKAYSGKKTTVKAGQTVWADRFATGKYMFDKTINGVTYTFYVSRTRVGSKSAEYTTAWNYHSQEIAHYLNDRGVKSKTPYVIMASTYTQHVYVFKGTKSGTKYKNWEVYKTASARTKNKYAYEKDLAKGTYMNWECGTGTASEPTPTSASGLKETTKWVKVRHSIPWWTKFHGTASFHGNKIRTNNKGLGKPVSNGCIRNPHERAHWIFDVCKNGTQVVIY
ncbi:MAG: L,D-transpeptidase [Mogibacterium sp.]|nr:L,D-transpeptidase [Mogibacterium sp.]